MSDNKVEQLAVAAAAEPASPLTPATGLVCLGAPAASHYTQLTSTEALLPASPAPQVWRHAAVEAIAHTEAQMIDLVAAGKELSVAQQNLRRSLLPLLEEAHGGQLKLAESLRASTGPAVEAVVQLVKTIEEEMFNYAHEKTRHTMLLDLHGVSGSPVETPSYGASRSGEALE